MKIVQIGANRGDDHVTELVRQVGADQIEQLILVEPITMVIPQLRECYKFLGDKCIIEQIAIVQMEDIQAVEIFYTPLMNPPELPPTYELASLIKAHHVGVPDKDIHSYFVPCMTINNLLDKYGITELDYLFIDTEALDAVIAESIDLDKYNIKNIQVEYIHGGHHLSDYFYQHGYYEQHSLDFHKFDKMFCKVKKL